MLIVFPTLSPSIFGFIKKGIWHERKQNCLSDLIVFPFYRSSVLFTIHRRLSRGGCVAWPMHWLFFKRFWQNVWLLHSFLASHHCQCEHPFWLWIDKPGKKEGIQSSTKKNGWWVKEGRRTKQNEGTRKVLIFDIAWYLRWISFYTQSRWC